MNSELPPVHPVTGNNPLGREAASSSAPTIHLINRNVTPVPPERRRLIWLRNGDTIQFRGGTKLTAALERASGKLPIVWLYYYRDEAQGMTVTPYQPVSMESEAACNVVPRAIAVTAAGEPLAVGIWLEGIDGAPDDALERRYA